MDAFNVIHLLPIAQFRVLHRPHCVHQPKRSLHIHNSNRSQTFSPILPEFRLQLDIRLGIESDSINIKSCDCLHLAVFNDIHDLDQFGRIRR